MSKTLQKWAEHNKPQSVPLTCDISDEAYYRELNRGKSFEYSEWAPLMTYTNDSFKQDFVKYKNSLLACKRTHVSSNYPELIYSDSGTVIGVNSDDWYLVLGQDVVYNNIHVDDSNIALGVPLFTEKMLSEMDPNVIPDTYVTINDLPQAIEEEEISSIDILFSTVRKLQAEVAKLRNAFKYGMYSYTGTNTALSAIVDDSTKESDALWSIDESDLSEISEYALDFEGSEFPFEPKQNVDITNKGILKFIGNCYWSDYLEELKNLLDPKLYLYLTLSDINAKFNLMSYDGTTLEISLKDVLNINKVSKYNIIFLISRKVQNIDDENYYGFNYIWISVRNKSNNSLLAEGFYNPKSNSLSKELITLTESYYISQINFENLDLYKFNFYSKYQDFSEEILPSTPNDEDYRYRVAHITIRSVKTYSELEKIQNQLPNNELIWEEANRKLWIKSQDTLVSIGNSTNQNTGMTQQETIELLQSMGIVYVEDDGNLHLSDISDVTFINQDTGKKFKFEVNPDGNLVSTPIPNKTLATRVADLKNKQAFSEDSSFRGFVAKLHCGEADVNAALTSDVGINSDRIKIGAVYCPLTTDSKYGCSHGYIELENTSDKDFPLEGTYLHYLHPSLDGYSIDHLALKGILYAGSTYLIRCKQYADITTNSNVYINVGTYDQEWYINGQLLDLSIDKDAPYAFMLTYGNDVDVDTAAVTIESGAITQQKYKWMWNYIDSLVINAKHSNKLWGISAIAAGSNSIIKNTFELDPAKQAFQALTTYDSSRCRTEKYPTDGQLVSLDKEFIEFPHSKLIYPVSKFTPKSSKEKKNVSTDKTSFDLEKPNIVNCAFGLNAYTTRCFNWVSAGDFDEYVFIKDGNSWKAYESYKSISDTNVLSDVFPRRKEWSVEINNTIYSRIHKTFPGCGIYYTSHKCIIDVVSSSVTTPTKYTYIVGRMLSDGMPDMDHCSSEQYFTLYPEDYKPRVYQITDQQGFHWIEYQVWSASAEALNNVIETDRVNDKIMPILINTGDVTQNGTRINEWLDYYNAGKPLFSHLEQMNVVGNNDLCGTNPEVLGTGDDVGKSNSFYFHVFNCYEVDPEETKVPLILGTDGVKRYVPSLYYFDVKDIRFLMINSEITYVNCRDWFKLTKNGNVVNAYTGWTVENSYEYDNSFTSIYTMIYNILNDDSSKKIIAVCHEMPYTVITNDSLSVDDKVKNNWRSFSGNGSSLIGSHLNQLCKTDIKYGIYWFSRLLEYFGVKLCIGGHKHTYAATLPIRENYMYRTEVDGELFDSINGPMPMTSTLENDNLVEWVKNSDEGTINTTKQSYVPSNSYHKHTENLIHPAVEVEGLTGGVTYFMCQATGYKLTSNKELPSNQQEFSCLIPQTNAGKADGNQQYPMFVEIDSDGNGFTIKLRRIEGILNSGKFSQSNHNTNNIRITSAKHNEDVTSRYCTWGDERSTIITIA